MSKKMNEMWDSVLAEFEQEFSTIAVDVVDWYPSGQMEITVKTENGDKYVYNWLYKSIRIVHSVDHDLEMEEEDWRKSFVHMLTHKMYRLGLSQDILSERTGISRVTISKYVNGKATPSSYNIRKLARALKCSTSELMDF